MSKTILEPAAPRTALMGMVFALCLTTLPLGVLAQDAVAAPPIGYVGLSDPAVGNAAAPLTAAQLGDLVAPIALYPDDLVGIVLPASTYPLQIVQAARFLTAQKSNPALRPDDDWDDSVVALLNYPEVVALMDGDLEWTWRLGQAVIAQQGEVIAAVADFRVRAQAAGNLRSDARQVVETKDGVIQIRPANPQLLYVPYYEPAQVVVYQAAPVYHYYPRPWPVYYYPYERGYPFGYSSFWGLTSAFSIGWLSHDVHVRHHRHRDHPYYKHRYDDRYYRRPHRDHGDRDHRHSGGRRDGYVWQHDDRRGGARPGKAERHERRRNQAGGGGPIRRQPPQAAPRPAPNTQQRAITTAPTQAPAAWQRARQTEGAATRPIQLTPRTGTGTPTNRGNAVPVDPTPRLSTRAPAPEQRGARQQAPALWQQRTRDTRGTPPAGVQLTPRPAAAAPATTGNRFVAPPAARAPALAPVQPQVMDSGRNQAPAPWQRARGNNQGAPAAAMQSTPRPRVGMAPDLRQAPATRVAPRAIAPAGNPGMAARQQGGGGGRQQAPAMWQKARGR